MTDAYLVTDGMKLSYIKGIFDTILTSTEVKEGEELSDDCKRIRDIILRADSQIFKKSF